MRFALVNSNAEHLVEKRSGSLSFTVDGRFLSMVVFCLPNFNGKRTYKSLVELTRILQSRFSTSLIPYIFLVAGHQKHLSVRHFFLLALWCHTDFFTFLQNSNMYSIRTICSVAVVLLASVVVNAAPMPMPAVSAHHVKPGGVFVAKPVHFEPQLVGSTSTIGCLAWNLAWLSIL